MYVRHGLVMRGVALISVTVWRAGQISTLIVVIRINIIMRMRVTVDGDVAGVDRVSRFRIVSMCWRRRRDAELHQSDRQQHNQEASHESHQFARYRRLVTRT